MSYTCHFFIKVNDSIWYGREFSQRYLKLFLPNLALFDFAISRFSLNFSHVGRFFIRKLKISFTKLGLRTHPCLTQINSFCPQQKTCFFNALL